jgi:hypothetical protein
MGESEIAELVSAATPYITAAVSAYGQAVLAKALNDVADTGTETGTGRRILQGVFGNTPLRELPEPLASLAADPADADALGAVRVVMRQALTNDPAMLADVRRILMATPPQNSITQHVRAGRDAYVAGRDITIRRD